MNSSPQQFAQEFFEHSTRYLEGSCKSTVIQFGSSAFNLHVNKYDQVGNLVLKSFIESKVATPEFSLQIWRSSKELEFPSIDWAQSYLGSDYLFPFSITEPFRIAFDKSQGLIFVYDVARKSGSIWVAPDREVSLNSFVTPFRLMLSWMAHEFDAEIVHASSVSINGKGLLINGPSGSGKSTLALLCLLSNYPMIADDVVLVEGGTIYSVYNYAKVDSTKNPLDLSQITTFKMEDSFESKEIIDLNTFGTNFMKASTLSVVILPIFAHLNHFERLRSSDAIKLMAPNSMRELMGGDAANFKRLVRIVNSVPVFRVALSSDNKKNIEILREVVSSL